MAWWIWILLGLALLAFEAMTPGGFFTLFFGIGAIVVGILVALEVGGPPWAQWLLFSFLSIVSLALFRRRLQHWMESRPPVQPPVDSLVGADAVLLDELAPGGVGKAELRGTSWNVRSDSPAAIPKGTRCRVERADGLTLWVRPERPL